MKPRKPRQPSPLTAAFIQQAELISIEAGLEDLTNNDGNYWNDDHYYWCNQVFRNLISPGINSGYLFT